MLDSERAAALGRIGAAAKHAAHDPSDDLKRARQAWESTFLKKARQQAEERGEQVSEDELERRAYHLREKHYAYMRLRSLEARRARQSAKKRWKRERAHDPEQIEEE